MMWPISDRHAGNRIPLGIMDDLKSRAARFAESWAGRGDEKSDTQQYWRDLLDKVLLIPNTSDRQTLWFERRTALDGFIDALMIQARVLVEQKSLGVDLDKPEPRQGTMVTPVEQAKRYSDSLPPSERPSVLITCNFGLFRLYDLEADPLARTPQSEFTLAELPNHINEIGRLFAHENSRVVQQEKLSVKAGQRVARLHDSLAKCFEHPDDPSEHDALAMLTVRLVFCLYAEDANLFKPDALRDYVAASSAERLGEDLYDLFEVLDTPIEKRRRYLPEPLKAFPYVDGGLFADQIDVPPLTEELRDALLEISEGFDWSGVSPVIFGSLMEETLSHDERRKGGMHYTSVKNIHRLIDPLFLDGLKAELEGAEARPVAGGSRTNALNKLHDKIADLRFLDPACGSGNFLTETYLELRRIENRILADLDKDGQLALDLGDDINPVKVSISHFHGIEINGFACAVARTALWIAEQQALDDTESTISGLPRLPFTDTAHIRQGNALRLDWNELLPGDHCDYVMGNPPFIGQYLMSDSQKEDMRLIWDKGYDGYLDYATGWHRKASEYLAKPGAAFAFVSTNSISQGQPVPSLFRPLFDEGWRIRFAHRTFAWDAQSTDNAHVHVVIVGMDKTSEPAPILFEYTDIDGEPAARTVDNINGYLLDGPNVFVEKRMKPLSSELSPAGRGSQPTDGGNLILDGRKEYDRAMSDPIAAKYVRPFRMGRELINGTNRWCLWMPGVEPSEIKSSSFLRDRVDAVKETRLASRKAVTRGKAMTAWLFDENHQPSTRYLAIPAVFSGRREYATCDWYTSDIIAGNKIYTCADPDGLAFAVIESCMFMTWQKAIGGRLKSDPNFSNTVVWNNLPLPALDDETRTALIEAGRNVLVARANHPGQSLADLYDPDYMPTDLRAAHRELDKVADVAFGARKWLKDDDDARLQVLFKSYTHMTGSSEV